MKSFLWLCFVGLIFALQEDYPDVELSDYVFLCDRQDPNRDECFKNSFQDVLQRLKGGNEALGLRPIDPMELKNIRFQFDSPLVIFRSLVIKNAKIYGLSDSVVNSMETGFTEDKARARVDVTIPMLFLEGYYKAETRYARNGSGPKGYFNVTMVEVTTVMDLMGSTVERAGETFLQMNKLKFVPEIENMRFYVEELFPDPELNRIALELINQNWKAFFDAMSGELVNIAEPFLIDFVNDVFSQIPSRKIFLN